MSDLPNVSIVTILRDWSQFHLLCEHHWKTIDYPKDKLEWILIDDFSEDGTKEKISEICSRDDRIKTIQAESKKQYWWNPQYAATGDVFAHLDADDRLLPNTFNHINYYFNKFPDVFFIHFYANKFSDVLPNNET